MHADSSPTRSRTSSLRLVSVAAALLLCPALSPAQTAPLSQPLPPEQGPGAPRQLALMENPTTLLPSSLATPEPAAAAPVTSLPDSPGSSSSVADAAPSLADSAPAPDLASPAQETVGARGVPQPSAQPSQEKPYALTVWHGRVAPPQTPKDKLIASLRDATSPYSLLGETISAGYAHITNGSPNYGTDSAAFGQRLGASVARGTSQKLFAEAALASLLHEDPRYYQLGRGTPILRRVVYAGTRPLITRTDAGRSTPNLSLLGGYLGAAELTQVYYPPLNQSQTEIMKTWGGSIGGSALGFALLEFLPDAAQVLHLTRFVRP